MRKAKVITALSLAVVMLAVMTGIAAAESIRPASGYGYHYEIPEDGTSVTVTFELDGFHKSWNAGQSHTIFAIITPFAGSSGSTSDLQYRITHDGVQSSWLTSSTPTTWIDDSQPDYVTLEIKAVNNPPVGAQYYIYVYDSWPISSTRSDSSYGTIDGKIIQSTIPIPEFATIAVPVTAVLGLLFFFNYRKRLRGIKDKGGEKGK